MRIVSRRDSRASPFGLVVATRRQLIFHFHERLGIVCISFSAGST
jgi:hypothetical protein